MLDFFSGKTPTPNQHIDDSNPILRTVRELFRIARNAQKDRRKHTEDRRRQEGNDFIVNLSHRREKRARLDRRQSIEFRAANNLLQERRKKRLDRRRSVNDGVLVKLSTKGDKRSGRDRRGNTPL